jgi:hypothetical protein
LNKEPDYSGWQKLGKQRPSASSSPFYSRIYAGYSPEQIKFIAAQVIETGLKPPIFDPMAGQAFALSALTWYGHDIRINDINPAPLLLAWLRSAVVLKNIDNRIDEFKKWLSGNKKRLDRLHIDHKTSLPFLTEWLSEPMVAQIQLYADMANEDNKPLELAEMSVWNELTIFRLAILVLTARRLTCHSQSDNRTWLKPGGLNNKPRLSEAITQELKILEECQLVASCKQETSLLQNDLKKLQLSCADIATTDLAVYRKRCITVTSPPYANRLDYSVMWAPELWVLSTALSCVDRDVIKRDQIGTTKIKHADGNELFNQLPLTTRKELRMIEKSTEYASKTYYYPFFRQFAQDLMTGLQHSVKASPKSEKWIIFIRDTARKDVMFSSHAICEAVMNASGFKRRKSDDLQIIRSHVGLLRRAQAKSSIHGLAQREWWLVFDRERE